ncbi:hypothetical protein FISHEDRAFT_68766 [Fistulina hepatica ATCC 64428]|uniref:Uncharacterized protein n=1 Tax=Fistulina hepatica ATCC 64428 TaxID=1128425 RepID=A0A0D7AQE9_9AGAR|nr:hypothetical protein FISHEDRAFT_68766 [Fistulina hepatica ATCC 64428]
MTRYRPPDISAIVRPREQFDIGPDGSVYSIDSIDPNASEADSALSGNDENSHAMAVQSSNTAYQQTMVQSVSQKSSPVRSSSPVQSASSVDVASPVSVSSEVSLVLDTSFLPSTSTLSSSDVMTSTVTEVSTSTTLPTAQSPTTPQATLSATSLTAVDSAASSSSVSALPSVSASSSTHSPPFYIGVVLLIIISVACIAAVLAWFIRLRIHRHQRKHYAASVLSLPWGATRSHSPLTIGGKQFSDFRTRDTSNDVGLGIRGHGAPRGSLQVTNMVSGDIHSLSSTNASPVIASPVPFTTLQPSTTDLCRTPKAISSQYLNLDGVGLGTPWSTVPAENPPPSSMVSRLRDSWNRRSTPVLTAAPDVAPVRQLSVPVTTSNDWAATLRQSVCNALFFGGVHANSPLEDTPSPLPTRSARRSSARHSHVGSSNVELGSDGFVGGELVGLSWSPELQRPQPAAVYDDRPCHGVSRASTRSVLSNPHPVHPGGPHIPAFSRGSTLVIPSRVPTPGDVGYYESGVGLEDYGLDGSGGLSRMSSATSRVSRYNASEQLAQQLLTQRRQAAEQD